MKQLVIFILVLLTNSILLSQNKSADSLRQEGSRIIIDNSDYAMFREYQGSYLQYHYGNVRMRQDSVYFRADTAIKEQNQMTAWQNVSIQQGDSLSTFSDSLFYEEDSMLAYLTYDVSLISGITQLFTEQMRYDVRRRVGWYNVGGLVLNREARLISKLGRLEVERDMMYFRDSVRISHPDFLLKSDSISYHLREEIAYIEGPTLMTFDSARLYCESGSYEVIPQQAVLWGNPQFIEGDKKATGQMMLFDGERNRTTLIGGQGQQAFYQDKDQESYADTIIYDAGTRQVFLLGRVTYDDGTSIARGQRYIYDLETEAIQGIGRGTIQLEDKEVSADRMSFEDGQTKGVASGRAIFRDTVNRIDVLGERINYQKKWEQMKTTEGRPLLMIYSKEGDTIFIVSDTLFSRLDTLHYMIDSVEVLDTIRLLTAYHDVRIWSENMSGRCDSLAYEETDSLFAMYGNPILWSDSSQITGDTIVLRMEQGVLHRMEALDNAYMVEWIVSDYFQQIKSRRMEARFSDGEVEQLWAIGNAQMYYYILDEEDAFIGLKESNCGSIRVRFDTTSSLQDLTFYNQIGGRIHPIQGIDPVSYRYPGFRWEWKKRPASILDLDMARSLYPLVPQAFRQQQQFEKSVKGQEINKKEAARKPELPEDKSTKEKINLE